MPDSDEERERKKRAIFDAMSPKHQQKIVKKVGYEKWDPFQEPKYPIDLRDQELEHKAVALYREFLEECGIEQFSNEYIQAAREMSRGLLNDEERYKAMFEFCCWYRTKKDKAKSR